jgi:hypothetical protein
MGFIENVNNISLHTDNIDTVAPHVNNIDTVATHVNNVDTIAPHVTNIDKVVPHVDNIDTISPHVGSIDIISPHVGSIDTVSNNINNVNITASSIDNVNTYASTYQGAKASDPTARNSGNGLQVGDLYFNTTINKMKVWDGSQWQLASSAVNGLLKKAQFTGDGTTTSFAVTGGFDATYGIVFLNGVDVTKDIDISDGQNIKFNTAPASGDEITSYFFGSFQIADALLATGDSSTVGDVTFIDSLKGVILTDRTKTDSNGNHIKYRLYIDNGNLGIEEV